MHITFKQAVTVAFEYVKSILTYFASYAVIYVLKLIFYGVLGLPLLILLLVIFADSWMVIISGYAVIILAVFFARKAWKGFDV